MGLFTKKPIEQVPDLQPELTHIVTLYTDTKGEWRSRIKSINGNIIADSGESYKNEHDCRVAFEHLRHAFQNGSYRVDVEEKKIRRKK